MLGKKNKFLWKEEIRASTEPRFKSLGPPNSRGLTTGPLATALWGGLGRWHN